MKNPTGYAKPRRLAAPKPRKQVRLDLKRRPAPRPADDELDLEPRSQFWKWVLLVALLHLVAIGIVFFIYESSSTVKPPEQFFSLLPQGDVVKGTPGAQAAHKLGPTTAAPAVHHTSPPPVATTQAKPIVPKPILPPPTIEPLTPNSLALDQPSPKPPPKPATPKVKVDLTLADAPTPAVVKPKPKPHHIKPVTTPTDETTDQDNNATANSNSTGLSREQIAARLGEKLDAAGIKNATQTGTSGSDHSKASPFAEFYAMLHDQVMDAWVVPNLIDDSAQNPVVEIHVEKDGRVPPESVRLTQSSGNQSYDDSAVTAAKSLGYLHEPLPDGCPPDISIVFKPNR